ncbi:MAG: hypothetical protein B7X34_01080, partial [Acidobacteriia bacterium 12-62-4]
RQCQILGAGAQQRVQHRLRLRAFGAGLVGGVAIALGGGLRPGAAALQPLRPLRFRPNLVIEANEGGAFPEEQWKGAVLRIGGLRCRLDARDQRCMMVNIDPLEPASANPAVLRAIAQNRNARFGMYGTTVQPGEVAVGDPVSIED